MTQCPNTTAGGCKCPEHYLGLAVHATDEVAYGTALLACRGPVRLSVVTLGPSADPQPCTGSMTCTCAQCAAATAYLTQRGGIGEGNASPFKTRKAA